MIDLDTLLTIARLDPDGGFDLAPDGCTLVFAWNKTGCWELYELPLDPPGNPIQLTHGSGAKLFPKYSPDGSRIAFVLDADGGESYDVCLYDRRSGVQISQTPDSRAAYQPNLSWSPDGHSLACLSDQNGVFNTWILTAGNRDGSVQPAREVYASVQPDWDVCWSPDGRWLAVVSEGYGQDYTITLVSADGKKSIPLMHAGHAINARAPRWSPGGHWLAFSSNIHGSYQLGIYELASGEITWLSTACGEHEQPAWSPEGGRIVSVVAEGPVSYLAIHDRNTGLWRNFKPPVGVCHAPRFSPDGARLYFIFESPSSPPDLWQFDLQTDEFHQLTCSMPPELASMAYVIPEHIHYSAMDGERVPALLFRPPGNPVPRPAVVWIHGGPNWLARMSWMPEIQAMLQRGWLVLAPNYRGSTGYGRAWQLANRFDLGGGDTLDVVAGADYLVRRGLADPERLAVTGRSHGGYLTMTCLTRFPDRWAGGSAVVPFLNWFTAHANSRADLQHWDIENFGRPDENHQKWHDHSPYFFLDQIRTPVQLICGENDPRCPASESIAARDALLSLGRTVDFLLFEGEGHTLLKTENILAAERRRMNFLSQVLDD